MKEIIIAYSIPEEVVNAIMMSYLNPRSKVISPDGDKNLFDITTGVL